jgi:general secretion pathway protein H
MARMDPMARAAKPPISATPTDAQRRDDGFTLLEVVCVMAIVAALAAIVTPRIPRGTSRPHFEAYATKAAAMLKWDRASSRIQQRAVATQLDVDRGLIRSGASGQILALPPDIKMTAVIAERCQGAPAGGAIVFLPSGMSCGGAITLMRPGMSLQIRVNWLTGGVEIVS